MVEKSADVNGTSLAPLSKTVTPVKKLPNPLQLKQAAKKDLAPDIKVRVKEPDLSKLPVHYPASSAASEAAYKMPGAVAEGAEGVAGKAKTLLKNLFKRADDHSGASPATYDVGPARSGGDTPQRMPQETIHGPKDTPPTKEIVRTPPPHGKKIYALGGKYPINTVAEVKKASAYFQTYQDRFLPEEKRQYCTNLVKQAKAHHVMDKLADEVLHYGSDSMAPLEVIRMNLDARKEYLPLPVMTPSGEVKVAKEVRVLDELVKTAHRLTPDGLATVVRAFDEKYGLDQKYDYLPDPYLSVLGFSKRANYSYIVPGSTMIVTDHELTKEKILSRRLELLSVLDSDVVNKLQKEPIETFETLPADLKKVVAKFVTMRDGQ